MLNAARRLLRTDLRDNRGCTALHLACADETTASHALPVTSIIAYTINRFPSLPVVRILLEAGAEVNSVDLNGEH